jgi:PAS domain S-box-containing protein
LGWRAAIHPDDVGRFVEEWRKALAAGKPFENEARVRRADGEYRWFQIRKVPMRDEQGNIAQWYGTGHDIEDYKEAQARLRRTETELQQVIDAIPAHVIVLEPNGHLVFANQQDLEYMGLTLREVRSEEALGRIFHPEDVERVRNARQRVLSQGMPFEVEARIQGENGQYRGFLIRVNPLKDESGRVVRWYGT